MKSIKSHGRKGILLSEALIYLLVSVMVLGILQMTLKMSSGVTEHLNASQLRWHITNERLEKEIANKTLELSSDNKTLKAKSPKPDGTYDIRIIQFYKKMLRYTTGKGGHVPLVENVSGQIDLKGNLVKITMFDKNKNKSEMYLVKND